MKCFSFEKWDATGNDFVVVNLATSSLKEVEYSSDLVRAVCNRESGVGADGVVLLEQSLDSEKPSRVVILNSDGSPGQMCGNALRCIGLALHRDGVGDKASEVRIGSRSVKIFPQGPEQCSVLMGKPAAVSPTLPAFVSIDSLNNVLGGKGYLVSFGNPHYVVPMEDIPTDWVERGTNAQAVAHQLLGTGGINCGFLSRSPSADGSYSLRVFERGAGATKSCGSGACAASAVLEHYLKVAAPHELELTGGKLSISRIKEGYLMTGKAILEFKGQWNLS